MAVPEFRIVPEIVQQLDAGARLFKALRRRRRVGANRKTCVSVYRAPGN
jgi:hypothetical protein